MVPRQFYDRFARTVVFVVSPHPDDSVLGAGGFIHRLTDPVAWSAIDGVSEADRPVVYTIVMTAGHRGVDDEFLRRHEMSAVRKANPALEEYLLQKTVDSIEDPKIEQELAVVRTDIRRGESRAESKILRVNESFFLDLNGIYRDHTISDEDREQVRELIDSVLARHEGWRRIVLVPHRDDMHPVHKLSTQLTLDYLDDGKLWSNTRVWQYESPWITFSPHQIEIVVPFDGIGMATKAEAMAVHRSQEYRTRYSDVARYRAQMKAETYPELLSGFGQSTHQWQYVEAFQELRPVMIYELPNELETV
jgi:LmbE family N-acetylglucosaminyl deacetylase